jgi:16S rRNA processing protein RimM
VEFMPEQRKPGPPKSRPAARRKNNTPSDGPLRPPVGQGRSRFKAARRQAPASPPPPKPPEPPAAIELPNLEKPEYIVIARVSSPFGLRGAVKADIRTDFPERFDELEEVFLRKPGSEERTAYTLLSARLQNEKQVVLRFKGLTKIEQAEALRGMDVTVPVSEVVPLPEGEYYIFQIIGLEVYSTKDEYVGRVVNVENLPANDVYVVRGPLSKNEVLIPAIKDVIKEVDLEAGRMTIELLDGLI